MKDFSEFMQEQILLFAGNGQFGTAHVHRSVLKSLNEFAGGSVLFDAISPEFLKGYESWLRSRKLSWNTVSTYVRAIRSIYNRAIADGVAAYKPQLFRRVFTGTKACVKRSLDRKFLSRLFTLPAGRLAYKNLAETNGLAKLMFMLRGIPFVDVAYLQKNDLNGNVLTYRRRKTGRMLSVSLTGEAMSLLRRLRSRDDSSPYLFPILKETGNAEDVYGQYRRALRKFNRSLEAIRRFMGMDQRISSYTIRHSWGTMAYHCEIHSGIICEAMGHSSIKVTETYLKPFGASRIDEANRLVIKALKESMKACTV